MNKCPNIENEYLSLAEEILFEGNATGDRTGTGTLSLFSRQLRHNHANGFPLLTTKKVFWKGVVEELLWIIRGETNVKSLQEKGVHIWDEWADKDGDLGPVYGHQWRFWGAESWFDHQKFDADPNFEAGIDQLKEVIERIKFKPDCRRLIVTAWNPTEISGMKLPPCHMMFQFKVYNGVLNLQLYQRSCDMFLGVPFNIASYSLLLHIVANICDLKVGEFSWVGGDCHIYNNHIDQVREQISREPRSLPNLKIKRKFGSIDDNLCFEDFELVDYNPHPAISAKVSV